MSTKLTQYPSSSEPIPKPGSYLTPTSGSYKNRQSDDEYQRHLADRRRREGREQDRFGQQARLNVEFIKGLVGVGDV